MKNKEEPDHSGDQPFEKQRVVVLPRSFNSSFFPVVVVAVNVPNATLHKLGPGNQRLHIPHNSCYIVGIGGLYSNVSMLFGELNLLITKLEGELVSQAMLRIS